jgi:hypothetical protein
MPAGDVPVSSGGSREQEGRFGMSEILDSGARREFGTGAVRDIAEEWKDVVGYEGLYQVSNIGRIRSLDTYAYNGVTYFFKRGRVLKLKFDDKGYYRVNLYKNGKCKIWLVNRLVALAYIPNPQNLPYVGHMNDVKTDNNVSNLYWTNASENLMHNGMHLKIAAKRDITKVIKALSVPVVGVSKSKTVYFDSMQDAQRHGFDCGKISMCVNGKRKTHKGYKWLRKDEYDANIGFGKQKAV